jgi:hypothetical protein
MEAMRIVCDKPRVRGDKGPVVPTWFILGSDWQVQGTVRQKQQQQQQTKAQANNNGAANSAAASGAAKSTGSAAEQVKQQHKGKQQQHTQPDAYAREQNSHMKSKPNTAAQGKRRRGQSAETEAEAHRQQQQQQQRYQSLDEDEEWPQESRYASLLGQRDSGNDAQRWLVRLAAQQDVVQADAERSSDDEDLSTLGFSKQDRAGFMGYNGHVRAQPEGHWRWYDDDADEGTADSAVQLQELSWAEDEPDWDDDRDEDD